MKRQYYWSLLIEPGFVQAAIWTIDGETSRVLAVGPSQTWTNTDNLVEATDATLSDCVTHFDSDEEPSQTVFGVPPSWVSDGAIKPEYLELLREVCGKLSLEPAGFVVLPEAIAHFVKAEEETPLNGVVIGITDNNLDIAVFRLGNLAGTVSVGRSESVLEDVVEGLVRFTGTDPLPSRFLLYDGTTANLEEVKQILIQADWTGELNVNLKFLHTPTVEIIDPRTKTVAVCLAGASEIANVSKVVFPQVVDEAPAMPDSNIHMQNFTQKLAPEDVGFVLDEDISDPLPEESNVGPAEPIPHHIENTLTHKKKLAVGLPLAGLTAKLKSLKLPKLPKVGKPSAGSHSPQISLNSESAMKKTVIGVGVVLAVLLVVGAIGWFAFAKAEVTVYISPRKIENRSTITLNQDIPSTSHEVSVDGERTSSATGRKLIGDKAKGEVQIRNGTGVGIKINAGTALIGSNNLKFDLDNQASISAAESPSSPGTGNVNVTAQAIGSDSNLGKDETLQVGNYPKSEVDAVVVNGLTGGSSREITAVSQSDMDSLKQELTTELLDKGREQLENELASDEILIIQSLSSTPESTEFSNKLGDEASTLRLNLGLKVTGLVVKKADLAKFAMDKLNSQVPSGFIMREEQIETEFTPVKTTDDSIVFDTQFIANLLPETNPDEIKKKIAGKPSNSAQSVLTSIPGFVRASIKLDPRLPGRLAIVPRRVENISLEITKE